MSTKVDEKNQDCIIAKYVVKGLICSTSLNGRKEPAEAREQTKTYHSLRPGYVN